MSTSLEPLGMRKGVLELREWDPRWPEIFSTLRSALLTRLGSRILEVEHVGSTSVPGLTAKPILDVLVGVPDLEQSLHLVPELGVMGFDFGPEDDVADRHYFRRGSDGLRTHHLSLAEPGSRHYHNSITFRDVLRRSTDLAATYAELKERLMRKHRFDSLSYMHGKTDFVLGVLSENSEMGADSTQGDRLG